MWRICRMFSWKNRLIIEVFSMSSFDFTNFSPIWSPLSSCDNYTHFNDFPSVYRVLQTLNALYGDGLCYIDEVVLYD